MAIKVKDLAALVGASTDRFLNQMVEAGLSQTSPEQLVTDHDKQVLLAFLRNVAK